MLKQNACYVPKIFGNKRQIMIYFIVMFQVFDSSKFQVLQIWRLVHYVQNVKLSPNHKSCTRTTEN
jgi:hypothetical protein